MAASAIQLGGTLAKLGITELLQHSLRLKNAKTENAAIAGVVAPYDQDLQAIVNAYNSGAADPATCVAALQQLDSRIYNQLRSGTITAGGAPIPGTAWSDSVGLAGKCNKQCTAGCCVYFGDLGPPLSLAQIAMGGKGGRWGTNDPRWKGNGLIVVPEVFASKYGGQDRPSYTIQITTPPLVNSAASSIKNTVNSLLGLTPSTPSNALSQVLSTPPSGGALGTVPSTGGPTSGLNLTYVVLGAFALFGLLLVALVAKK